MLGFVGGGGEAEGGRVEMVSGIGNWDRRSYLWGIMAMRPCQGHMHLLICRR